MYLSKNLELNDILSLFSCNRGMCLLENETHVANYCTFNMKETNAPINVKPAEGEAGHRAGF